MQLHFKDHQFFKASFNALLVILTTIFLSLYLYSTEPELEKLLSNFGFYMFAWILFITTVLIILLHIKRIQEVKNLKFQMESLQYVSDRRKSFLSSVFSSISEWVRIVDHKGNVRYVNDKMKAVFPTNKAVKCWEMLGLKEKCENCMVFKAISEGLTTKKKLILPNGKEYLITASPIIEADGTIHSAVESIVDITKLSVIKESLTLQLEMGEVLEESIQELLFLALSIDFLPNGVAIVNKKCDIIHANPVFTKIFPNLSGEELKKFLNLTSIPKSEVEFTVKNNGYLTCRIVPLLQTGEEFEAVAIIIEDKRDLIRMGQLLNKEQKLVSAVTSAFEVGLCVITKDRSIKWTNRNIGKVFAVNPKTCRDLFDNGSCKNCRLSEVLEERKKVSYKAYNSRLDKHFSIVVSPLNKEEAIMVVRDISISEKVKEEKEAILGKSVGVVNRVQAGSTQLRHSTEKLFMVTQKRKNGES